MNDLDAGRYERIVNDAMKVLDMRDPIKRGVCEKCGAVVADKARHIKWHREQEAG
jgi:hypothetical protein